MSTMAPQAAAEAPFVISRTFDAPRERVWRAFTEVEHLQRWFTPKGFTAKVARMDFRPGGTYHYGLRSPEGKDMWGRAVYQEIAEPERLVWINAFSDERGGLTRHPMTPSWPLQMVTTVSLAEGDGRTTVTIRWVPFEPTEEERRTFDGAHDSMRQGWTGTLDQLADYLGRSF